MLKKVYLFFVKTFLTEAMRSIASVKESLKIESHYVFIYTYIQTQTQMINLGKKLSNAMSNLVLMARDAAMQSRLTLRHGAVLFSKKHIHQACCNDLGSKVCGFDVPSLHAEANCLKPIYNRAGRLGCLYSRRAPKQCQIREHLRE
jgi:hypothetical protein